MRRRPWWRWRSVSRRDLTGCGTGHPVGSSRSRRPPGERPATCRSHRRHRIRSGQPGLGRRISRGRPPFGMIQWSPDTTPNRAGAGGGYCTADPHLRVQPDPSQRHGLRQLWGRPILPTIGRSVARRARVASFSHATERVAPGRYGVTLGPSKVRHRWPSPPGPASPSSPSRAPVQANVLFKVAGSANPVSAACPAGRPTGWPVR